MYKTFPTLYKVNSRGKIQEWEIGVESSPTNDVWYTVVYGQQGGSKVSSSTMITEGKNIGKANETTALEQALLEAESKWKKQQDKGYRTIPTVSFPTNGPGDPKQYLPMLAKSYQDYAHKITFPCCVQPKLDGIRCIAYYDGEVRLLSRRGKPMKAMGHIAAALEPLFRKYPDMILDGELFTRKVSFQSLTSAIKRDSANQESQNIEYWVYDHFSDDDFDVRNLEVKERLMKLSIASHDVIKIVTTSLIHKDMEVYTSHDHWVKQGFEGVMLRNRKGGYQRDKRSDNLQKVKSFLDAEFEVVDAEENKGKQAGQCTFICVTKDGKRFGVKPMGTDQERRAYWQHKNDYIGKELTVRFFEYSNDGVPRFPVGVSFRDYE